MLHNCCGLPGRGVFALRDILQGQFLAHYCGQLVSEKEGERREAVAQTGYRYFFQHSGCCYWYTACLFLTLRIETTFCDINMHCIPRSLRAKV